MTALLAICFATIATNGRALMAVLLAGTLTPTLVLAWIDIGMLRDNVFGVRKEPLASTKRDPLGFNDTVRNDESEMDHAS